MPFLPSLPDDGVLLHVFRKFPDTARPLLEFHEVLLRGPSPLSVTQREMIAAYVSGLNACNYCQGVHQATAQALGFPGELLTALLRDLDSAAIDAKMKPLLRYVKKLTQSPSRVTRTDAQTVFDAGWDEQALHDAVAVCALFNFMNRFVSGLGIEAGADYFRQASQRLADKSYAGLARLLDESPPDAPA